MWIRSLICLAAVLLDAGACAAEREPGPGAVAKQMAPAEAVDSESGGDGSAAAPAAAIGRKRIRTARMDLLIEDYDQARPAIERLLARVGGVLSDASVQHYSQHRSAELTLRVPAGALDRALRDLRALGKVENESLATEDVTRQYVDTDARLRNLTETETRLRALLQDHGGELSSILEVEREITRVRGDIEALTAQLQQLDERVALSTVHLGLREEAPDIVHEPDDMWKPLRRLGRNAWVILEVSVGALVAFLAAVLTMLLYALPWLIPAALVLVLKPRWRRGLVARLRRRRKGTGAEEER